MLDNFALHQVALAIVGMLFISRYGLQLYENKFWSMYLYSIIASHKERKFVS